MNVHRNEPDGLPLWLTATVVITMLGAFVYNLVIYGPDGYPTAVIIGGLLGAYAGLERLVKRKRGDIDPQPPNPGPPT